MTPIRKTLFILLDQCRADCISGALADHTELPNIRALMADAVTFSHHFSVTNPCGPARASILTGLYAMNHRSVRNRTPIGGHHSNLALELQKAGIAPLLFGYTDTSYDPRGLAEGDPRLRDYEQVAPGFTEVVEMRQDTASFPWRRFLADKGYTLPEYRDFYNPVSPDPARPARPDDPPFYRAEDSDTAYLTDRYLEFMANDPPPDRLTFLTYIRPHPPLVAPAPYNRMVNPAALPLPCRMATPKDEEAVHPVLAAKRQRPPMEALVQGCDGQVSSTRDADVQMLRAIYLGLVSEVDRHVGRIIADLKARGEYDETLIIFSADHGEMLGDHHMWGKQHVYDPAFRVPLIIRDPAYPATFGSEVATLTESVDLAPTILDLMGVAVPPAMNGRSLRAFLQCDPPEDWRDAVHLELDFGDPDRATAAQRATGLSADEANLAILREAYWKLVHFNGDLPPLLFDLAADPDEMVDLAADPAHAGTLLRLTRKLLNHRMQHQDRALTGMKIMGGGRVFGHEFA